MIYPPGYFHHTNVEHKDANAAVVLHTKPDAAWWNDAAIVGRISVASAFYFPTVPWYGSLRGASGGPGEYSPFGYETCANGNPTGETSGWFARSSVWEEWFAEPPPPPPPPTTTTTPTQPEHPRAESHAEQRRARTGRGSLKARSEPVGAHVRVQAVRKVAQDSPALAALVLVLVLVLGFCVYSASGRSRAFNLTEHGKHT